MTVRTTDFGSISRPLSSEQNTVGVNFSIFRANCSRAFIRQPLGSREVAYSCVNRTISRYSSQRVL
jgi:hypothetical protein